MEVLNALPLSPDQTMGDLCPRFQRGHGPGSASQPGSIQFDPEWRTLDGSGSGRDKGGSRAAVSLFKPSSSNPVANRV
jgi:hypothetical protein